MRNSTATVLATSALGGVVGGISAISAYLVMKKITRKSIAGDFVYTEEVSMALRAKKPVVALESTIISHGLPYPTNLDVAHKCMEAVRSQGAVPATIAIVRGKVHIGLSEEDLEFIAKPENKQQVTKVSRRDLPLVLAREGAYGATTVAATMLLASQAGIQIFATGGIGGVHRGAEETFDESTDLGEFTHSPVLVVTAGVKSVLDIPKTLERLETLGVPVLGYKTDEFPAFHCSSSGILLPKGNRVEGPAEVAAIWAKQRQVLPEFGAILANPIPSESSMSNTEISELVDQALREAQDNGVTGKDVTPFLLAYLAERSDGRTIDANIALVVNNATIAA